MPKGRRVYTWRRTETQETARNGCSGTVPTSPIEFEGSTAFDVACAANAADAISAFALIELENEDADLPSVDKFVSRVDDAPFDWFHVNHNIVSDTGFF